MHITIADKLKSLQRYTACDISDALFKLRVPNAGVLPDLQLFGKPAPASSIQSPGPQVTISPITTLLFIPKGHSAAEENEKYGPPNIPSDTHWADLNSAGTCLVMSQPQEQINAVLGGIMALRAKILGVKEIIVWGRVRDVADIEPIGLPTWAKATSTVGAGLASKAYAKDVELDLGGTIVEPEDWVFCDAANGVVVIPKDKLDDVVEMVPRLVQMDERVMEAVKGGMGVGEAFKRYR